MTEPEDVHLTVIAKRLSRIESSLAVILERLKTQRERADLLAARVDSDAHRIAANERYRSKATGYMAGAAAAVSLAVSLVFGWLEPRAPDLAPIESQIERMSERIADVGAGYEHHIARHPDAQLQTQIDRLTRRVDALIERIPSNHAEPARPARP